MWVGKEGSSIYQAFLSLRVDRGWAKKPYACTKLAISLNCVYASRRTRGSSWAIMVAGAFNSLFLLVAPAQSLCSRLRLAPVEQPVHGLDKVRNADGMWDQLA